MQPKAKQQQKRLNANVRQAKSDKEDLRKAPNTKNTKAPPAKNAGGFLSRLMAKIFGRKDPPKTAQQSIPYQEMYKDGICRISDRLYSKTVAFGDLNYHLAQPDDQTTIFEHYGDFLNYFDSSLGGQLSFINLPANTEDLRRMVEIPHFDDACEPLRNEFGGFLENQQSKGNNGMIKTKFATFTVEADNFKAAKLRAERVEADILNNYKTLGAPARSLDGKERLETLFNILHPDGADKFRFDW